tara:strand:- start:3148 stop:3546 length:399 start_codon:yes stop_codon:yes gene_type:complete
MFRLYAIIIVVGLLGGAAYGAKYYYDTTQNTIAQLRDNNAKLEVANETNQATIDKMGADAERLNNLTNQLVQDLQKSEKYGDELRNTLNKHNLTHLANKKPGLIEKRMQNATDKLWDDLESITSSDSDSTTE